MKHNHHKKVYLLVWAALLVLTAITVQVAYHDFGVWNIVVAMGVATIKGSLVCLFFMHLIEDNRLNQVVFTSSFLFLLIFVGLTASDELFRPAPTAAKVFAVEPPVASQAAKMEQLRHTTPELVEKGRGVYLANCQACHGASGTGDGPAAAALTPKPRDFTSGVWKQGGAPAQVFKTVSDGMSGTSMPPFSSLSVEDRWALVHFIRSLSPNLVADTPATLSAIGIQGEGGVPTAVAKPTPELPVNFIIQRMAAEKK